jgi:hypothetical protein
MRLALIAAVLFLTSCDKMFEQTAPAKAEPKIKIGNSGF